MIDIHDAALAAVNEGHHTFLLRYRKDGKVVYGIVEGKDDPLFYRNFIDRFIPEEWSVTLVRAGNRDKVLEIYNSLDWSVYNRNQIAFFIDRDLSDFTNAQDIISENIYTTDGYSIENSIVNSHVFLRVLTEVYNVADLTPDEERIVVDIFNSDLAAFQEAISPIMSEIVYWRRNSIKSNLNDIDLREIFSFKSGRISINSGYDDHASLRSYAVSRTGAARCPTELGTALLDEFYNLGGPARFVRGKYLLWYLSQAVSSLHSNIQNFSRTYKMPPKVKLSVGSANFMVVAAPRARCPASLRSFIEETYSKFIGDMAPSPAS